jgi:hypothetical protein
LQHPVILKTALKMLPLYLKDYIFLPPKKPPDIKISTCNLVGCDIVLFDG